MNEKDMWDEHVKNQCYGLNVLICFKCLPSSFYRTLMCPEEWLTQPLNRTGVMWLIVGWCVIVCSSDACPGICGRSWAAAARPAGSGGPPAAARGRPGPRSCAAWRCTRCRGSSADGPTAGLPLPLPTISY